MKKHGVVLSTWRHGWDVMDRCTELVEKEIREIERDGGGGSGGQAVERQTKRARGKRNGSPLLFLLSYAEHEERGPRARQNTFQNVQSQVASCGQRQI